MKNKEFKELLKGSEKTYLLTTNNGCAVEGTIPETLTMLTMTIRSLRENINDEMLKHAFELAFKNEEELKILTLEAMKNMLDRLGDMNE